MGFLMLLAIMVCTWLMNYTIYLVYKFRSTLMIQYAEKSRAFQLVKERIAVSSGMSVQEMAKQIADEANQTDATKGNGVELGSLMAPGVFASVTDFIQEMPEKIEIALTASGLISLMLTIGIVTLIWFLMVRNYKLTLLDLRSGSDAIIPHNERKKYKLIYAQPYIGLQGMSVFIGFITMFIILWAIFFFICFDNTREAVGTLLVPILIGLVGGPLVLTLARLVVNEYLVKGGKYYGRDIRARALYSVSDTLFTFLGVLTAFSAALARLFLG